MSALSPALTESEYESMTRRHWFDLVPDADDVTVAVRDHAGAVVRYVRITRESAVTIDPAACLSTPPDA